MESLLGGSREDCAETSCQEPMRGSAVPTCAAKSKPSKKENDASLCMIPRQAVHPPPDNNTKRTVLRARVESFQVTMLSRGRILYCRFFHRSSTISDWLDLEPDKRRKIRQLPDFRLTL